MNHEDRSMGRLIDDREYSEGVAESRRCVPLDARLGVVAVIETGQSAPSPF